MAGKRLIVTVAGAVQGVGFRPMVWHLAAKNSLGGFVKNTSGGLQIDVEGSREKLSEFLQSIQSNPPVNACISSLSWHWSKPLGRKKFEILKSRNGLPNTSILPDLRTCHDCLKEVDDISARRRDYAFTNCTHCGPRFSIIQSIPYDRQNTTMGRFEMCPDCREEYLDPGDRRFHAQPIACPECGPRLGNLEEKYSSKNVQTGIERAGSIQDVKTALNQGKIVALKGLGGYQLITLPGAEFVENLRKRKSRDAKPFALMFPSMDSIHSHCHFGVEEEKILTSATAPIVLLQKRTHPGTQNLLAGNIAPDSSTHGCMLPYSPLHHLLLQAMEVPLIVTSGNVSGEPICITEKEAEERLLGIADVFCHHNRPVSRPVDDSVVTTVNKKSILFRRARGFVPLPVVFDGKVQDMIAMGGHLKNTMALARNSEATLSQHIGDLDTPESLRLYRESIADFKQLFKMNPEYAVCDLHPDYASTSIALQMGYKILGVQHHVAHVLSCMAENQLSEDVLGVSWDGTGYGTDGTIWGGEFFIAGKNGVERKGSLIPFRLPGGEKAVVEPLRCSLSMLYHLFPDRAGEFAQELGLNAKQCRVLIQLLKKGFASPLTSSMGRLFDGVAGILGLCHKIHFEGQAAMRLESAAWKAGEAEPLPFDFIRDPIGLIRVDWRPVIKEIWNRKKFDTVEVLAMRFHTTLAHIALRFAIDSGMKKIVFSGGCFQNRLLMKLIDDLFNQHNLQAYFHSKVPPNDGGLSLGQVQYAAWFGNKEL